MKLHNPFNQPSHLLDISLSILFTATTYGLVLLLFHYSSVVMAIVLFVIPIVLLAAVIRVIYAVIKGEGDTYE
jgi:hypothetical protein